MEKNLLAAAMRSRADYNLICDYIEVRSSTYSKPFQIVMKKVGEYYTRDNGVGQVVPEILVAQISESIRNEKHITHFKQFIGESLATTSSDANVRAVILIAKQQEVGDKLAQTLSRDSSDPKADALLKELVELRSLTSLDDLTEKGLVRHQNVDLRALIASEFDPDSFIKLSPNSLNDKLGGGAKRGHHIIAFAVVEAGKSALCINMNSRFCRDGLKSLYFINEDRDEDIIMRHVSNLSGMTKGQVYADPELAQELATRNGFNNTIIIGASPGSPQQIEAEVEEHKPDVIIVDQLRNLKVKAESRVNQLEAAATAMRDIGKKHNVLVISVTQAADSARNKLELDAGDVDFSNVGIPGQADVLLGLSMDESMMKEDIRNISLPKNKISGCHDTFPVRIIPQLSRIKSV